MKKTTILTALVIFTTLAFGSFAPQNGYDQFQKALAKERGEGSLEEAIVLYQKVIDGTKDEALAAQAQLRIGICYEKRGQEKAKLAQEAFQKVVDKYPAQTETVETAREKLKLLLRPHPALAKGGTGLSIRSVLKDTPLYSPQVSPDGRAMASVHYGRGNESGGISIYDMETGKVQALKCRFEQDDLEWDIGSFRWSRDSRSIVCSWWGTMDYVWTDLRILSLDGAGPRKLVSGGSKKVLVYDWSADGSRILAARFPSSPDAGCQIVTFKVSDGSMEVIKEIGQKGPSNLCFSPDGRFIAYDAPSGKSTASDIYVLTADGREELPLVESPTNDLLFGWTPDGGHVFFASDRGGSWGAWLVPVRDGRAQGAPKLIKPDIGPVKPIGFTRDGAFYYHTSGWDHDVYVQRIDVEKGALLGPAEMAVQRFVGSNYYADWSPDGNHLAYVSRRTPSVSSAAADILCIRDMKSGQERELFPKLEWFRYMRWSPDGRSLMARGSDGTQAVEFVIDAVTGAVSAVLIDVFSPIVEWSPDGRSIYYALHDEKELTSAIMVRSLETKQEKKIADTNQKGRIIGDFSVSPDGRSIAARIADISQKSAFLALFPAEGGEVRILSELGQQGSSLVGGLAWSPDSRKIIFVKQLPKEQPSPGRYELWLFSTESGDQRKLGELENMTSWLSLHPDGRSLVFTASVQRSAIWVMENFLPAGRESKSGRE